MLNEKLKTIISDLSSGNDSNIFNNICLALTKAIDADYVFIAKVSDDNRHAHTVAVVSDSQLVDNFSYDLADTPCDNVRKQGVCSHINGVQQYYPNDQLLIDMGVHGYVGVPLCVRSDNANAILVALYRQPINNVDEVESLFLLFSGFIEKELVKQEYLSELELIHQIVQSSSDGILICDENNKIVYTNKNFSAITQYSREEVHGKSPSILSSGRHDSLFFQRMWRRLNSVGKWSGEIINKRKNGELFPEWLVIRSVFDQDGKVSRYIGQFSDMTEQKVTERKLYKQANYDALTDLANRNLLLSTIDNHQTELGVGEATGVLLVFDIDSFRSINTLYDQHFGDQMLIAVADGINSIADGSETLARLGNDTFAIFCPFMVDVESIKQKIKAIHQLFDSRFSVRGVPIECTNSLGAANVERGDGGANLLLKAEQAHQIAKDRSCNSFKLYNKTIQSELDRTNHLKDALSKAIANMDIEVHYQPLVNCRSGRVDRVEALARWNLNGEIIPPDLFIPLAEKTGQIRALGEVVLLKSCLMVQHLDQAGFNSVGISVNRSVYEFSAQSDQTLDWLDTIEQHNIAPDRICFELTESILATELSNSFDILKQLKRQGCAIAIDDFGTGYSSLSYLTRIDADLLKIDRSFVQDMFNSSEASILINTIISMAKALGMKVIAEGVETSEQVEYLTNLRCDSLQGYFFAKPMPATNMLQYLAEKASEPCSEASSITDEMV